MAAHWPARRPRAHHLVADDFVILSCGYAEEALTWTRAVMAKLGLTLNEAKTSVKDAGTESFDFLGYSLDHATTLTAAAGTMLDPVHEERAADQSESQRSADAGQ